MIKARARKNNKILKPLYLHTAREVIVTFAEMTTAKDTQPIEDKALKLVDTALLTSDLKKYTFCGARFSLALSLVLTNHYPRGPNNAKPSVIDVCFLRGHITAHVNS
jgi:hypothetical protein